MQFKNIIYKKIDQILNYDSLAWKDIIKNEFNLLKYDPYPFNLLKLMKKIKILIKNSNSVINLTWGNIPQATQYFIYRSINALSRFQENLVFS